MVVPPTAPSRATRELAEKISRLVSEHRSAHLRMTDAEVDQALRQSIRALHKEPSALGIAPLVATALGFLVALAIGVAVALARQPAMRGVPDENLLGPIAAGAAALAAVVFAVLRRSRR